MARNARLLAPLAHASSRIGFSQATPSAREAGPTTTTVCSEATNAFKGAASTACRHRNVAAPAAEQTRAHQDLMALARDLRVHELEREFALSAMPLVKTRKGFEPEPSTRERALARVRIAAARWAIKEIEAALARKEDGEYGTCEWCSRPISPELLAAAPMGRLCGGCRTRD
jgi:RNA polymerase-binding transcription factor DksA